MNYLNQSMSILLHVREVDNKCIFSTLTNLWDNYSYYIIGTYRFNHLLCNELKKISIHEKTNDATSIHFIVFLHINT